MTLKLGEVVSIKVYSGIEGNWNIVFTYSPLFEMLSSLHVLAKPEHHLERLEWANNARSNLPDKLYKSLMDYSKKTFEWSALMDLCSSYEECDDFNIMAALDFLGELPVKAYYDIFVGYDSAYEKQMDPKFPNKMVRILKEYYLTYFDKELRFIEPLLIRRLRKDSELCRTIGILSFVRELHNRIEVTENAFLFHKQTLYTIPFDTIKRVVVRISSFIDPHLFIDHGNGLALFTIRAHLEKGINEVPRDLLRLMKALSDETRLRILRIIYKGKASTQSLSLELSLSEAGVSKHLKILYDADLLYKERCGSYIYYYLNIPLLDMIPLDLHEYMNFTS